MNNYYNIDNVNRRAEKENANFIIIYGGKSKGKSYQAKLKLMLQNYLNTGKRFVLLRRFEDELSKTKIELYFSDMNKNNEFLEMTGNKYNSITKIADKIYFIRIENGKIISKEHIGYAIALNTEQNFSSILSSKDINKIIFEEFQSRTRYITDECEKFDFLYSTIDREQGTTKVYFMGNAISKACPYWAHFGILDLIKKQKSNTIKSYEKNGKKILIEKTPVFNGKTTTVGDSAGAIARGDWYSTKQPQIKMKGHKRGIFYVNFDFNGLLFLGQLNCDDTGAPYWFIREVEYFKNKKNLTVSNKAKSDYNYTDNIYKINNERIKKIIDKTFRKDKIFFSTNESGTDFKTACIFNIH